MSQFDLAQGDAISRKYKRVGTCFGKLPGRVLTMVSTRSNVQLGKCPVGFSGVISGFTVTANGETDDRIDQLREMGFAEGIDVEILHQNPFGRDPIAVRVGAMTIALRRREADLVQVRQA